MNKLSKNLSKEIALILLITMTVSIFALPSTDAHPTPWAIPTYAYISVTPNPVGVGQDLNVVVWVDKALPGAAAANSVRFNDYKVTITKPDNTTETINWPICTDTTSSAYSKYTPTMTGTYSFVFTHPNMTYTWNGEYKDDVFMGSTSGTVYVTVQEDPITSHIAGTPLPSEYWTRPIEGQNTNWYTIASNWLGSGSPQIGRSLVQPDGIAPNAAHVMWTKPIQDGGIVGGSNVGQPGNSYYMGLSYNARFSNPIIMYGRLYYELPNGNSGSGGPLVCVDLQTGEELWRTNTTGTGSPSFAYLYDFQDPNQHGVLPQGLLYTNNFAKAYEPTTGVPTNTNITDVPSGTAVLGNSGEHIRYAVTNYGTNKNPQWYLNAWNSSKMNQLTLGQIGAGNWYPGNFNASDKRMYDFNVSLPFLTTSGMSIWTAFLDDVLLGGNGTMPYSATTGHPMTGQPPFTLWAISLKPETRGQLIWMKNYDPIEGNVTLLRGPVDADSRVFVITQKETIVMDGYDLDTGKKLYTTQRQTDWDYYISGSVSSWPKIAYGNLYSSSYGGILYCYGARNGTLMWTYGNGGAGNSTSSSTETVWGNYPSFIGAFADGKVYTYVIEHSPNSPIYKGARFRCINATTGAEIWTLSGFGDSFGTTVGMAIADGYMTYLNAYDMQVYCIGKGPSQTSVAASPKVSVRGNSVIIEGTVIDTAAGTQQKEQAARFPNGVAAVSDESQSAWMEYVYMQKIRPTDATGVPVTLSVIDANGNYRQIGTTTSDADGYFSYNWTPDIEGKYTLYASFEGSESYWPSHAVTSFAVDAAPEAPTPQPTQPASMADLYFLPATIGLFIAIIVIGLVMILMLRKRP